MGSACPLSVDGLCFRSWLCWGAGCLVFAYAVGLCNDITAGTFLGAGKIQTQQLLPEEPHLTVLLVSVSAEWHVCGRVLARMVPSRTAVLPPVPGSELPLPVFSSSPAFPTSPSCSQWHGLPIAPTAAVRAGGAHGSCSRLYLHLRACLSFQCQAAGAGVAMVSVCPAGGKAAVPLLAEAVSQCWAGPWLCPAMGSVPLSLQSPACLWRAEQLLRSEQDRPPSAFWPLNTCACCFILLERNLLGNSLFNK